jgi:hypothetical protein
MVKSKEFYKIKRFSWTKVNILEVMAPMFRFGYEKFNLDDDGMRTIFIFAENLAFHLQFVMAKKKAHLLLLSFFRENSTSR